MDGYNAQSAQTGRYYVMRLTAYSHSRQQPHFLSPPCHTTVFVQSACFVFLEQSTNNETPRQHLTQAQPILEHLLIPSPPSHQTSTVFAKPPVLSNSLLRDSLGLLPEHENMPTRTIVHPLGRCISPPPPYRWEASVWHPATPETTTPSNRRLHSPNTIIETRINSCHGQEKIANTTKC